MRPVHGLVIGKFYPPHKGHHLLVETAANQCDWVTVVVMAAQVESLTLKQRVGWMREIHSHTPNVRITGIVDDFPVDLESDAIWRAHVALMQKAAANVDARPIDAIFTSEGYGEELGRRLHARHVSIDPERNLVPISATRVRADPAGAWTYLSPVVRGALARRLVLVGAESTGKTTLAAALAEAWRTRGGAHGLTRCVEEYGRDFTYTLLGQKRAQAQLLGLPRPANHELVWSTTDLTHIASQQNQREDADARIGGPLLVCDTDAFATAIWHETLLGHRSAAVECLARAHPLYLLTHPDDMPFVQDGTREEARRHTMTALFVKRLTETGRHWQWLRGNHEQRLGAAVHAAEDLLARGWGLAPPLG